LVGSTAFSCKNFVLVLAWATLMSTRGDWWRDARYSALGRCVTEMMRWWRINAIVVDSRAYSFYILVYTGITLKYVYVKRVVTSTVIFALIYCTQLHTLCPKWPNIVRQ
jgi:hypothetical protein